MNNENNEITVDFLDHVAIRVANINAPAEWYHKVLGLKKYQLPDWGAYPIFMPMRKFGVALFPANQSDTKLDPHSKIVKIDPFAYNVTNENFEKPKSILKIWTCITPYRTTIIFITFIQRIRILTAIPLN